MSIQHITTAFSIKKVMIGAMTQQHALLFHHRNLGHGIFSGVAIASILFFFPAHHASSTTTASAPVHQRWGTPETPFAADSLWNSRPVDPQFHDFQIPPADYYPSVAQGKWSTGVFLATPSDPPMTIHGLPGHEGVWDPDAEASRTVTLPHWPHDVTPASGTDGHADIIDLDRNMIHSFWQLRQANGKWFAAQYSWTRLNGRGWADPAHYFQGARAAAVPTLAGLIRKHEVADGQPIYRHVLAMSLTFNALEASPGYIFPATSTDTDAAKRNTGRIPLGALLMLPPTFDTSRLKDPSLRRVAETLKVYGAYVVDANHGTPFQIYVENGADFDLHKDGWNAIAAADLQEIRRSLRQVSTTRGWIDGNNKRFYPTSNLNRLSMRGPWRLLQGNEVGQFDSWRQAVLFPASVNRIVQMNDSSRSIRPVFWAKLIPGRMYKLTAHATGGATLRLQLHDKKSGRRVFDSGELKTGKSCIFAWPTVDSGVTVQVSSGIGQASSVQGSLVEHSAHKTKTVNTKSRTALPEHRSAASASN
ncbi:Atrophin-1 multi-domain protein [Noviherbaspirillum malthae]|uniref:Atrophin-1 multi-domain protein n=1 Tax=Noviherbaspirillum malthae TaxID=1260987 RepID=UPI0018909981|nr:Atrophin-1 multi-domain protein [Noviherbaspirillum malthae]